MYSDIINMKMKKNDSAVDNNPADNKLSSEKIITSNYFEYKTKIIGRTSNDNNTLET